MKSRRLAQVALAVAVSLVIAYFVMTQLRWHDVATLASTADAGPLLLGFGAYLLANLVRAWRFRALTGDRISTAWLFRAVLLQNFLNTFLPLRAGEASYLYMVHRTGTVDPGQNLGALVGARALDFIAALMIPLLALPLASVHSEQDQAFMWFAALALAAACAFALGIWQAERLGRWLGTLAERRQGMRQKVLRLGSSTLGALARLRGARLLGRVAGLTGLCWVLIYLSGYASLVGIGVHIPFWDSVFAYSFPNIASMTPFYMLGGFGVYEGSMGMGLRLVGVELATAMAASLILHVAELIFLILPLPVVLLGRARQSADSA